MTDLVETDPVAAATGDPVPFVVTEPTERAYVRTSATVLRLVGAAVLVAVMYALLEGADPRAFSSAFADVLATAPRWLVSGIVSVGQLGFMLPAVLGFVVQLALRRFGRVGRMLLAAAVCVAGLVLMSKWVGPPNFPVFPRHGHHHSQPASRAIALSGYGIGAVFPTTMDFGMIASWIFVDGQFWSARWRRIGRVVLVLGIIARLGVGLADPTTILATLAIALLATRLVQAVLGVPNTRPRGAVVGRTLERLGYDVTSVDRAGGYRGYIAFGVQLADERRLFVKIVGRDSWASLFPVRLYRAARFRDAGQDRPFRSLRSIVEHEALCALKAHSDGVSTARVAVVTEFPPDAMLIAFDSLPSRSLAEIDVDSRPPGVLEKVWEIVASLQRSHTVHRRLNAESVLVRDDGTIALVEFGSASLGVVGPTLSTDVAEVLAATAARLGVQTSVAAAVAGVGPATVAAALPRLQPLALTRPTRAAMKAADCLDDLRDEVQRVTGADAAPVAELERIKARTIATVVMVAVALFTLIPQLVGFSSVWTKLGEANWAWAAAALGLSAVTYVGAALALDGSLSERLPLAPNVGVQLATSFVGVAAPGGALALTARFLQKRGVDGATAAAAVGVDTLAGVVVHLTLTGLFVALAGSSGLQTFNLPSIGTIGLILGAVVLLGAIGAAVPWSRSLVTTRLVPATRRSLASVGEIARQPAKMIELFGGSIAITLGYVLALEVAVAAFGAGPSFTSVALVYLVGSVVSSIAPTPGGIGAVEATLIAGLTSAGMASATAVAAVLLFRLATFWLPMLPGWGAFAVLQRSGDL